MKKYILITGCLFCLSLMAAAQNRPYKIILKSTDYNKLVQESHYDGKCGLLTVIPPIKPSGKTAAK